MSRENILKIEILNVAKNATYVIFMGPWKRLMSV